MSNLGVGLYPFYCHILSAPDVRCHMAISYSNCLDHRETNNAFHFAKVENWALLPHILDSDLLLKKAVVYLGVRINCSNNDWVG